ncbi:MAG: molybdopterin-binding protein [Gammaproteobacteria bacterium]
MRFGVIIIGDELLSGKRRDRHLSRVIETLGAQGLELAWGLLLGDDAGDITATLRRTLAGAEAVFCFGGIGATPDDRTRQCAAEAAGVTLARHPDAVREIESQFGPAAYPQRIRMAELPAGSVIIPNPYNRIPGFTLGDHHFLPGFPDMAWPMLDWVLDRYYATQRPERAPVEHRLRLRGHYESELLTLMEDFTRRFPDLRLSSLPTLAGGGPEIELGVRGAPPAAAEGCAWLHGALDAAGVAWEPLDPPDGPGA